MRTRLFILSVLIAARAGWHPASAQSSADSAAIEAAVAQHSKSLANPHVMFDSRFGFTGAERSAVRNQAIARILGFPVGHTDRVPCTANCPVAGSQFNVAMAFTQIKITGDSATVGVGTAGTHKGRATSYEEEDILARTNGTWRFVRVGRVEVS